MRTSNFKQWFAAIVQGVIGNIILLALGAIGLLAFNKTTAQIFIGSCTVLILFCLNWRAIRYQLSRLPDWLPLPFERDVFFDFSGYFLGLLGSSDGNFAHGFQAQGYNSSNQCISDFTGYIQSKITGERFPILFNVEGDLYKPEETNGIPPKCKFLINAPLTYSGDYSAFKMPLAEFRKDWISFSVFIKCRNRKYIKKFNKKQVNTLLNHWETVMLGGQKAKVTLKKTKQRLSDCP